MRGKAGIVQYAEMFSSLPLSPPSVAFGFICGCNTCHYTSVAYRPAWGGWPTSQSTPDLWVPPGLAFETWECTAVIPPRSGPEGLNLHGADFSCGVVPEARPSPILRLLNQSALDRIAMHVVQLLHPLLFVMYVENRSSAPARKAAPGFEPIQITSGPESLWTARPSSARRPADVRAPA
jgi:hypothetical protein